MFNKLIDFFASIFYDDGVYKPTLAMLVFLPFILCFPLVTLVRGFKLSD